MRIEEDVKLDFGDVLIRPKRSTLVSRKNVILDREFKFKHSKNIWKGVPVVASNMDHTGTIAMEHTLSDYNMLTALCKFIECSEWGWNKNIMRTIGLDQDLEFPTPTWICIDIANGYTQGAGATTTIDTLAYGTDDRVFEYTIFLKVGSDFQSQKVLAMRDGTTIHSTQFAIMFSSSLLFQVEAVNSGSNILLRVTPETGVSGSANYRVKREVM